MSNAVAELKPGGDIAAFVPKDTADVRNMALMIAQSGMAPKGMERPEKIAVAIIAGMEAGLTPLDAVNSISVINGRPSMWGDALLGLVLGSGLVEDIKEELNGQGDQMEAKCSIKRKGLLSPTVRTFSVADAKTAGLWNKQGPWQQYPKRMLQVRARAFALRDLFPDVLRGIGIREEMQDYRDLAAQRSQTTNPVSVKEIASDQTVQGDEPEVVEDAEVVDLKHMTSDEAEAYIKRVVAVDSAEAYEAMTAEIFPALEEYADTPLRQSVGRAIKAKRDSLKEASQQKNEQTGDMFPGDLPEGQSLADEQE